MFGNVSKRKLFVSIVLFYFCFYILKLFIQKDITLYIHPRYVWFAVVMCSLGAVILVAGVVLQIKKRLVSTEKSLSFNLIDVAVLAVLALAFILPAQALSSRAIERKTLQVPTSNTGISTNDCPTEEPLSVDMWVYTLSEYPHSCFTGKEITMTGFVIETTANPLPEDMYYVGRTVIACCVIDARPYGLPVKKGEFQTYPKDTWLTIRGTFEVATLRGYEQLIVNPSAVRTVDNPDQPYEFIDTKSTFSW